MTVCDVIYPLGYGSLIDNMEIRFSLRSLRKYGQNIGNIYVIGQKPNLNWGERLIYIPFEDRYSSPAVNIWHKALEIAEDPRISDRFLWMNDDFYILEEFDVGRVPYFHQGAQIHLARSNSPYQQVIGRTIEALKKRGATTFHFGTHQPINYEKQKILELFDEFEKDLYPMYGISLRLCYGNYFSVEKTTGVTALIRQDRMPTTEGRFCIASHDSVEADFLASQLNVLYPEPSNFEIQ